MVPVHGGEIDAFDTFVRSEVERQPHGLSEKTLRRLIYNYGSAYSEVLQYLESRDRSQSLDEDFAVLRAEAIHGARDEMARKLSDVVFRRTELGSAGHPGDEALRVCASAMSAELRWSAERTRAEIEETSQAFRFGGCHSITT
jgi:glycerol-3-phosphate dehydrogenase